MKITNIKINSFRCFNELNLDINSPQAFVGENGSGKTTILEAINLAASQGYAGLKLEEQDFCLGKDDIEIQITFDKHFINKVPDGYNFQNIPCRQVIFKARRRKLSSGKALSDEFVIEHYSIPDVYTTTRPTVSIKDFDSNTLPSKIEKVDEGKFRLTRRSTGRTMDLGTHLMSLNNDLVGFPNVFYFDREREKEAKRGFGTLLQKLIRDLNWRYKKEADQALIGSEWEDYYQEVIKLVEDKKTSQIVEPLRKGLTKILGEEFPNLELSLLPLQQPFNFSFFAMRDAKSTNQIEISGVGSGVSILISFLLLKIISEMSKEEIILLIDEPELHLHPQAQANLFQEFKESNYQIIYTTQSDLFIDISDWRAITRLTTQYDCYPKKSSLDTVRNSLTIAQHLDEIKKYYQHETIYLREDNQIFFAKKCLLVEGAGDRYGLPRFAKTMGNGFRDLTIINCHGKSKIPYYQLLCRSFSIPYFTLFDLDGKQDTDSENQIVTQWTNSDATATFITSFEELLGVDGSRGSDVCAKVDDISTPENIPQEIKDIIEKIITWSQNI